MFKFFRKYMKWLLAGFGSVLMVVFLLPIDKMIPSGEQRNPVIAAFVGGIIKQSDLIAANRELGLLAGFRLTVPMDATTRQPDGLAWLLVQHEAVEHFNLHTTDQQADAMLQALNVDQELLTLIASNQNMTLNDVRQAARRWLIAEQYRKLTAGVGKLTSADQQILSAQADQQNEIAKFYNQLGRSNEVFAAQLQMQMILYAKQQGRFRISEPLVQTILSDIGGGAGIEAVRIDIPDDSDQAPEPDADEVQSLFEQYKSSFKGAGEPYGFGYRLPDRIKIEYLDLPFKTVSQKVNVSEHDLYAYYNENKEFMFRQQDTPKPPSTDNPSASETGADPDKPKYQPYAEVRDRIEERLRADKAGQLADQIMQQAINILEKHRKQAKLKRNEDGYFLTADYQPITLAQIAEQIAADDRFFAIKPNVVRNDRDWLTRQQVAALANISQSLWFTPQGGRIGFAPYAFAVYEIAGKAEVAAQLDLQTNLPSQMLINPATSDRYLFRVIDTAAQRDPESLDEVHDQVTADAKRLAAYRELQKTREQWLARAKQTPLSELAEELKTELVAPPAFPQRRTGLGSLSAPNVPGVGQDKRFVDAVFALIEQAQDAEGSIEQTPREQLIDVAPVDGQQSLFIVEVKSHQPLTKQRYLDEAGAPMAAFTAMISIRGDQNMDPYDRQTLMNRLGFAWKDGFGPDEDDDSGNDSGGDSGGEGDSESENE